MTDPLSWQALEAAHSRKSPGTFVHPTKVVRHGDANLDAHLKVCLAYPGLRLMHSDPPVFNVDNLLSPEVCERMMRQTLSGRGISMGASATHGSIGTTRSSSSWLLHNSDCSELIDYAQILTGLSSDNFEAVQVLRYRGDTGEHYSCHYDHLSQESSRGSQGNRLATLIVYLNSPSGSGGETHFRDLGLEISPIQGNGLLFFPSFSEGEPDFRTAHEAKTVDGQNSVKWLAQIFVRQYPFSTADRAAALGF